MMLISYRSSCNYNDAGLFKYHGLSCLWSDNCYVVYVFLELLSVGYLSIKQVKYVFLAIKSFRINEPSSTQPYKT